MLPRGAVAGVVTMVMVTAVMTGGGDAAALTPRQQVMQTHLDTISSLLDILLKKVECADDVKSSCNLTSVFPLDDSSTMLEVDPSIVDLNNSTLVDNLNELDNSTLVDNLNELDNTTLVEEEDELNNATLLDDTSPSEFPFIDNSTLDTTLNSTQNSTYSPDDNPFSCDYQALYQSHSVLLPKNDDPGCLIHNTGVTEEEKQLILQLHNDMRAQVARGEEQRGDPGPQPGAADMIELIWNDELAYVAQAWASQCPQGHDDLGARRICSKRYQVGQNIHYYWGYQEESNWTRAVDDWYREVADMPYNITESFKLLQSEKKIGHYTQVVWASTQEVGCGMIYFQTEYKERTFPNAKIYVCNYGPSGNVLDRPMYQPGPAASACPNGPSTTYPDLCAAS